jgi:triosephosphate isomerase
MRKKIIAGNWKMNVTAPEAEDYVETLLREVNNENRVEIVLVPPFTAIPIVSQKLDAVQNIRVGAQNMHWEKEGAFTGEISAPMLRALFVRYVVLGHSERRALFGETDEIVNRKLRSAIDATLKPIVCIGETLEQRDAGQVEVILERQLRDSLAGLDTDEMLETVIAYEPVWAIGTGRTATPDQAQEAHAFIRQVIGQIWDEPTAAKVRIQYGGSVKPNNTAALLGQPDIDGALVGGASLDARSFAEIIKAACSLFDDGE